MAEGWNISPQKQGTGGAKQGMTEAAEGEMSQLQGKGFAQCKELGAVWMMNMGYTGCSWSHRRPKEKKQ